MTRRCWLPAVVLVSTSLASTLPAEEPKPRVIYEGHSSTVLSVAFSPDGKTVASAAKEPGAQVFVVALWNAETGKKIKVFKGDVNEPIRSVCFSPDGKEVARSGEYSAAAKVYDPALVAGMRIGFVALSQRCPHQGCAVPWCPSSQWFECPCHGSRFDLAEQEMLLCPRPPA